MEGEYEAEKDDADQRSQQGSKADGHEGKPKVVGLLASNHRKHGTIPEEVEWLRCAAPLS